MNEITTVENNELSYRKDVFELGQREAKLLACSTIVPTNFQNNISNCYIALELAHRMRMQPMVVMQSLYIIHGRPSFSSKFLISAFNSSKKFKSMKFKFTGEKGKDSWGCIASSEEKESGEIFEGAEITMKIAKDEGWYAKTGSKWKTMPQLMLMYRAASFFISIHAPEITNGMQTTEENNDIYDAEVVKSDEIEKEISEKGNDIEIDVKIDDPTITDKKVKETIIVDGDIVEEKTGIIIEEVNTDGPGF